MAFDASFRALNDSRWASCTKTTASTTPSVLDLLDEPAVENIHIEALKPVTAAPITNIHIPAGPVTTGSSNSTPNLKASTKIGLVTAADIKVIESNFRGIPLLLPVLASGASTPLIKPPTGPCSIHSATSYKNCNTLCKNDSCSRIRAMWHTDHPSIFDGTPYPVSHDILERTYRGPSDEEALLTLNDNNTRLNRGHAKATFEREWLWVETPEIMAAIARLQTLRTLPHWGPDIVFKAFNDIDIAFFDGWVGNYARLRWSTKEEESLQHSWGLHKWRWGPLTDIESDPCTYSCEIILNSDLIFANNPSQPGNTDWEEMWGTLIHEMVHVYLQVGGYSFARNWLWGDADRDHGEHFQRTLTAINHTMQVVGLQGIHECEHAHEAPLNCYCEGDCHCRAAFQEYEDFSEINEPENYSLTPAAEFLLAELDEWIQSPAGRRAAKKPRRYAPGF